MENREFKDKDFNKKCFICLGSLKYYLTHYDSFLKTSNKKYDVYKCENCGLLKIIPEPSLEEIKTFYPKGYYSFNSETNSKFLENLKDEILNIHYKTKMKSLPIHLLAYIFINSMNALPLNYPKYNGKFLDIGCGDGYWLDKLEKYGWDCTGVDFIGKGNIKIRIGNFLEMDFKEKYEFIRMSHVLEHVVDPEKYLFKIKRLLDNKGEAHISLPNTNSVCCKIFGRYWSGLEVPRHIHNFNFKNLKILIERNGLKIKMVKYNSRESFSTSMLNFFNIFFNRNIADRFHIFMAITILIDKFFDILELGSYITFIVENE